MQKNVLARIFLIIGFIFCEIFLIFQIDAFYDNKKEKLLEQNIIDVKARFNIVNKILIDLANSSFRGFINKENIKEVFSNRDREKLYELLKNDYSYLSSLGFKQIHFHLPNNKSFLRMHEPKRYEDDLTSIRYTVEYTNKNHKSINGFETGRVLPGIRNLYPLFHNNKYIGSVELSFGMEKLETEIEKVYKIHSHFLINKEKFNKTVFKEYKIYYKQSIENENYVEVIRKDEDPFFKNKIFDKKSLEIINNKLKKEKSFNIELYTLEKEHFIVTFLPITSVKGDNTMYFTFYEQNDELKLCHNYKRNKKIVFSLLLIGVFLVIYLLMRNKEIFLNAKDNIEKEKTKYKNLMNLASDGIFISDLNGNIYESNRSFAKMLDYNTKEILKLNISDFDKKFSSVELDELIKKVIRKQTVFTTKYKRKDGSVFDAQLNAKAVEIDEETYIYTSVRDITEQRLAYKKLEKFIDLQDNIVIVSDLTKLIFANKRFFEFTGFKNIEQFHEKFNSISELFIKNNRFFYVEEKNKNWIKQLQNLSNSQRIVGMKTQNKNTQAFAVNINKFENNYYILSFTDITQTMLNNMELEDKTIHDKLTKALNREYFELENKTIIKEFTKNNYKLAIAFLDIDHFKKVNDNFGHDIGDELLIQFVKTIQKNSRENDILIRWGGEEFILLLKIKNIENLEKALENIRKSIETENFKIVKHITCSIGASIYHQDEDINKTIKRADESVYKAKAGGRNKIVIL